MANIGLAVLAGVLPLIPGLVGAHDHDAIHHGSVDHKLLKLAMGVRLFFAPYVSQPFFICCIIGTIPGCCWGCIPIWICGGLT